MHLFRHSLLILLLVLLARPVFGQSTEAPKREFRAAWIATVTRLDWPPSGTPDEQKQALISKLDQLKSLNFNAVIFQIRTEGDALYASTLEPWSYWLTGEQGKAPEPFYDPLEFAIEEAHKRGMELHAWFNPYRAEQVRGRYETDTMHVTKRHPDWILTFPNTSISIMDPGKQVVRDYNARVVMDVVRRYDIDGVHFDDYFYPYPSGSFSGITNQDDATYAAERRGINDRGDWRRDNVNIFIRQVADSIAAVKPHVKFGVSPFGIWKSGTPSGIVGLNAYTTIYADAIAWLDDESLDYLTPQLYWAFGGGQDYGRLSLWWRDQVVARERHLYAGHAAYRTNYSWGELPRQVRHNRANDIPGSVFFRTNDVIFNTNTIRDSLRVNLYNRPALPPVMPWKETLPPNAPVNLEATASGRDITLTWEPPAPAEDGDEARWYALYRFSSAPTLPDDLNSNAALLGVFGGDKTSHLDRTPAWPVTTYHYVLTALDRNWNESVPSVVVTVTSAEGSSEVPDEVLLGDVLPNPFADELQIAFTLGRSSHVTVRVYNLLGQEVATLLHADPRSPGEHRVQWRPEASVANGAYMIVLEADGQRLSRMVTHVR